MIGKVFMKRLIQGIVIVGNGEDWQQEKIVYFCQKADYIIAADNGLAILHRFQLKPDLIIGDLDSVSPLLLKHYPHVPVEKYPSQKDFTDSELSIHKAISMHPKEIILLAMTGNYFDHSYASIINLFRNYQSDTEIKIITSNSMIFPVMQKTTLQNLKGRRFSLFPLCPVRKFSLVGARYQFSKNNLEVTDYSMSNVIISDRLEINFEEGMLFCVLFDPNLQ